MSDINIDSVSTSAAVIPATEEKPVSAVALMEAEALCAVSTRSFIKKDKYTLKVPTFNEFLARSLNISIDDKEAMKAARKTEGIQLGYRNARKEITAQVAAIKSRAASSGLQVRAVEVGICKKTGEVLDYTEKMAEVKVPKQSSGLTKADLEAKLLAVMAELAKTKALAITEAEATVDVA